ncbi:zinc finger BED domain-containing protein 5-like [Macrobrachium rosenbergii]|uniref:zinc finger BED domain-containing protein 5-like n=1 Tax=Macrobrachium rosenbergii TaxID=79674 RepID=UPI0034D6601F
MIDNFFSEHGINWENCVGLCTDGAQSMSGRHAELHALVREKAPNASWAHCLLHREALASSGMNEELGHLLKDVVRVVNYIKNSPLKGRLFAKLCKDFGAEHTALLYYYESHCLSRGKVLQRVYELRNEMSTFRREHENRDGDLFTDDYFIQKLAYMVDIFEKINHLNQSMQGPHKNIFTQSDKISVFMKKIELRIRSIENNIFDMFPN